MLMHAHTYLFLAFLILMISLHVNGCTTAKTQTPKKSEESKRQKTYAGFGDYMDQYF